MEALKALGKSLILFISTSIESVKNLLLPVWERVVFGGRKSPHGFELVSKKQRQEVSAGHRLQSGHVFIDTKYPVLAIVAVFLFAIVAYALPEKYQLANLAVEARHRLVSGCLVSETYDEKTRQCLVSTEAQTLATLTEEDKKIKAKNSAGKEMVLAEATVAPDDVSTIEATILDPTKKTITLTGILTDNNGQPVESTYEVRFAIYTVNRTELDPYPSDSDQGKRIWEEIQTVQIKKGLFQVNLGQVKDLPIFTTLENSQFYVGMRIGTDSEMAPRRRISTPFFSINSANALLLNGKRVGIGAGDIIALDAEGKVSLANLPTGTGSNQVVVGRID